MSDSTRPCSPTCATPHDVAGHRGWRHVDPRRWVRAGDRRSIPLEVVSSGGVYVVSLPGATMRPSRVAERSHATVEDAIRAAEAEMRRG